MHGPSVESGGHVGAGSSGGETNSPAAPANRHCSASLRSMALSSLGILPSTGNCTITAISTSTCMAIYSCVWMKNVDQRGQSEPLPGAERVHLALRLGAWPFVSFCAVSCWICGKSILTAGRRCPKLNWKSIPVFGRRRTSGDIGCKPFIVLWNGEILPFECTDSLC